MMVSPEFVVDGKNREELEQEKARINEEINNYLKGNISEEEKNVKPSPETMYKMNLEYIKSIDNRLELISYEVPNTLLNYVYVTNGKVFPKQKLPRELEEEFDKFSNQNS